MSDEAKASEAVKKLILKLATQGSESGMWGNEELRVLAEALHKAVTAYIQLIIAGE